MINAKRFILFALLIFTLFAGGCVRTTHPILNDDQVISNDSLLGKWISKDGKSSAELKPAENGKYKLTYIDDDGRKGNFIIRFGKIGDVTVAEVSADAFTPEMSDEYKSLLAPMYMMAVIEKTDPELVLTTPSIDWLKKYVQAHPDELDVNNPDDLIVQAPTNDMQAFFIRHFKEDGMLSGRTVFVRPAIPPAGK